MIHRASLGEESFMRLVRRSASLVPLAFLTVLGLALLGGSAAAASRGAMTDHVRFHGRLVCDPAFTGGPENNTFIGTAGPDVMCGGGGNDVLIGLGGDDSLFGEGDNDLLRGGPGNDSLDGGAGVNTADYSDDTSGAAPLRIDLSGTVLVLCAGAPCADDADGDLGHDTFTGGTVQNVIGSPFADRIIGDSGPNSLLGGAGGDTMTGRVGNDVVDGQGGADKLTGGSGADSLDGGAGADQENGNKGADAVRGDSEDDTVRGGGNDDTVVGGSGGDTILGNAGNDLLRGADGVNGNDTINGKDGTNACDSDPGDTVVHCDSVAAPNNAPVAVADPAAGLEPDYVTFDNGLLFVAAPGVLGNDTDADAGDGLSAEGATVPAHGTVDVNADGSFLYTPDGTFTGTDTFTYAATDGVAFSPAAIVSIDVQASNQVPVADAQSTSTNEDTLKTITLTASDADDDPLTFTVTSGPSHGGLDTTTPAADCSAVNTCSAQVDYTPALNYNGPDSFDFKVNDGTVDSAPATVSITVVAVNDAPTAAAHTLSTSSGIRVTIGAGDTEKLKDGASDVDDPFGDLTVSATFTNVTPAGADVVLTDASTGTYTYNPPPGYTGAASFQYTVCDDGAPVAPQMCSAPATVSVTVGGTDLWFVDDSATPGGTGRLTDPFQALSDLPAGRGTGDRIFLFSGTYATGHTLFVGEHLIGQGASGSFDTLLGVVVPANGTLDTRPSLGGAAPTVGGTVTLATNSKLQGVAISSGANTGLTNAAPVTGVSVSQTSVTSTTGTALLLNNVDGTLDFTDVSKDGAGTGISLTAVNAPTSISAGTIQNTTTGAVFIDGGSGNFSDAGAISNISSGRAVTVQNKSADAVVTFSGALGSVGTPLGGTGVLLDNNDQGGSGGGVTFSGGVNLSTGSNAAFTATNGGTVTVTGSSNTLATTTSTALNVTGTTIGASGLTFKSINAGTGSGTTGDGIILDTTGTSGGLTVVGDGSNNANGTGGTIQHKSGADGSTSQGIGIYLNNTKSPSFSSMNLHDFDNFAIFGGQVNGLTMQGVVVNGTNGSSIASPPIEGAVVFDVSSTNGSLTGTANITSSTINGGFGDNLRVNNLGGTLTLNVTNSNLNNPVFASSQDDMLLVANNSATMTATVKGSSFVNHQSGVLAGSGSPRGIQAVANGNSNMTVNVGGSNPGDPNTFDTSFVQLDLAQNSTGEFHYLIQGNTVQYLAGYSSSVAINLFTGANVTGLMSGSVLNNTITHDATLAASSAINLSDTGDGAYVSKVSGNNVTWSSGGLINASAGNVGSSSSPMDVTITSNTMNLTTPSAGQHGILVNAGTGAGDTNSVCADVKTNNVTRATGTAGSTIRVRNRFTGITFRLPGYGGSATDMTAVQNFLAAQNTLTPNQGADANTVTATNAVGGTGFGGGAACTQPS